MLPLRVTKLLESIGDTVRLTLRTLLAYRDHVLASNDHEDLHHRIHRSADATNLLKRIGLVIQGVAKSGGRRIGKQSSLNPNDVAEYLDDVLGGTRVSELERSCLEADERLAEIGHCHEILSTAFQTQVRLPSQVRAKAIAIGKASPITGRIESTAAIPAPPPFSNGLKLTDLDGSRKPMNASDSNVQIQVVSPMIASGGDSIRPKGLNLEESRLATEVPEYLIGRQRLRWFAPAALLGLLLLFAFLVSQTLGPWSTIASLFTRSEVATGPVPAQPANPSPEPASPNQSSHQAPSEPTISPSVEATGQAVEGMGANSSSSPSSSQLAEPKTRQNAAPNATTGANGTKPPADQTIAPESAESDTSPPVTASELPDQTGYLLLQDDNRPAIVMTAKGELLAATAKPMPLAVGTQILTPPATGARLNVDNAVELALNGLNSIDLGTKDTAGVPRLGLNIAHLVCTATKDTVTIIDTAIGPFRISFKGPSASATMELTHRRTAWGSLAETKNFAPYLVLIAAEGTVTCVPLDNAGKPVESQQIEITAGQGAAFTTKQQSLRFQVKQIPTWVRPESVRSIDLLAARQLAEFLSQKQASAKLDTLLIEATQNRRYEVAALAIQCKALQGDFGAFCFEMLTNANFRAHWTSTIDLVQQTIAADASKVQQLRKAIETNFGQNQSVVEQLLFESLPNPPSTSEEWNALVDHLASDSLAIRVLANHFLENWSGTPLNYLPTAENRKDLIQKIKRDVNSGRSWQTPPLRPLYERLP